MTTPQRGMLPRKIGLLLFLVTIIGLYFFGHNVGEARLNLLNGLSTVTRIAYDLGMVAILLLVSGGLGRRVLQRMNMTRLSRAENVAMQAGLGLGIVAVVTATIGLLGQFNWLLWILLAVTGFIVRREIFNWFGGLRTVTSTALQRPTPWERFIAWVTVVLLAAALLLALAPPFAWDAMTYHLVIPQTYLEAGAVVQNLDNHFFGFPQNMEMLYGLLMMTGTDRAPAVLHLVMGVLALMAIGGFVRRTASAKAAYTAVLLLMASFNLWQIFGWPYVDLALMTYGALAVIAIIEWRADDGQGWRWLALTAILCGLAAGVKYTAAPLLMAVYVLIVLRQPRQIVQNTLIYGAFGALIFAPWLAKGLLLYDNPVYPYVFGGANWDEVRSVNFSESDKGLLAEGELIFTAQVPLLPLAATIFGMDKVTPYRFTTGPFLLMLPFALLFGWGLLRASARRIGRDLIVMALVVLVFWMVLAATSGIGGQTRLMLVGIPLAAMLGGLAYHSIENWQRRPIDVVFITQAALIVGLLFGSFDYLTYFARTRVIEYHAGAISEDTYISTNIGAVHNATVFLETLPEGSTVLYLWEGKTYHCTEQITCVPDILFDNWARPLQLGATPEDVIAGWREAGIDYILLHDAPTLPDGYTLWLEYHSLSRERNALFPQFFYDSVEPIYDDGVAYAIYQWVD